MTIYNHEGVRAELVDGSAIVLYVEGVMYVEITLEEWHSISDSIKAVTP